jgi:hypothetical protein
MNDDLHLAISLSQREDDDEWVTLPFNQGHVVKKWVDDREAIDCYKCQSPFGWWRRRHHCRNCGQIFCYECSNHYRTLNNPLNPFPVSPSKTFSKLDPHRVCTGCAKAIDKQSEQYRLWNIFSFLDLKTTKAIMPVCKKYYLVGKAHCRTLNRIQYYPIDKKLTADETDLLLKNWEHLQGHSRWMPALLKVNPNIDVFQMKRNTDCRNLGCGLGCQESLPVEDLVQIVVYLPLKNRLLKFCCAEIRDKITVDEASSLILLLMTKTYLKSISHLLIDLSKKSDRLFFLIYWESLLNDKVMKETMEQHYLQYPGHQSHLISGLKDTFLELSFLNCVGYEEIRKILVKNQLYFLDQGEIWIASQVISDQIEIKRSKSRPALIPFKNRKGSLKKFLYKADNLKKDFIITQIISLMIYYIRRELQLDFKFINYHIYLLKNDYGLIEVIDDSYTIYDIRNKLGMSILNYILESNPQETVESVRNKFINSLAVYSVITYLLGIGDRHLDNIMVHRSGYLFHIDFEYILGDDPKIVSQTMRITNDMLETIGGKNSQNYLIFKNRCSAIFNCLRKHLHIFVALLSLLANDRLSKTRIVDEMSKRFEPGEKYLSAETYITTIIDNSHDTLTNGIMDTFYRFAKIFR